MSTIYRKYYVTSTERPAVSDRAKVWYWLTDIRRSNGDWDLHVTICAKTYGQRLSMHGVPNVRNETDSMLDYFEKDRTDIFPSDPQWEEVFAMACDAVARRELRANKRRNK